MEIEQLVQDILVITRNSGREKDARNDLTKLLQKALATPAADQAERCKHGVWAADRCENCVAERDAWLEKQATPELVQYLKDNPDALKSAADRSITAALPPATGISSSFIYTENDQPDELIKNALAVFYAKHDECEEDLPSMRAAIEYALQSSLLMREAINHRLLKAAKKAEQFMSCYGNGGATESLRCSIITELREAFYGIEEAAEQPRKSSDD
ncbi:MAG TPA: hypothetical protein VFE62_26190 [Gemmataceae bacterium]|nr:hypothetical protein [Gemmataceae bacterium]